MHIHKENGDAVRLLAEDHNGKATFIPWDAVFNEDDWAGGNPGPDAVTMPASAFHAAYRSATPEEVGGADEVAKPKHKVLPASKEIDLSKKENVKEEPEKAATASHGGSKDGGGGPSEKGA